MRIALFVYDRPHRKSVQVLLKLWELDRPPSVLIAAPWIDLSHGTPDPPKSALRVKPRHIGLEHPGAVAERLNIPFVVSPHTERRTSTTLRDHRIDLGVIGGARILPGHVIDACPLGILNLHPGLLPDVRGMDALKWCVLRDHPPGVTAHLIDEAVDGGRILIRQRIPVYMDDTWIDLSLRIEESELELVPGALAMVEHEESRALVDPVTSSVVNRAVPAELNEELCRRFPDWRSEMSAS